MTPVMTTERFRGRLLLQLRSVRTRIVAAVALLTGLALLGAGLAAYVVVSDRVNDRIKAAVTQELAEFQTLQNQGVDPATGERFASARRLMRVALGRQVPDENEKIVAYLGDRPTLESAGSLIGDLPAVAAAVQPLLPEGGSTYVETMRGTTLVAVKPVVDADTAGAYMVAYFVDDERAAFLGVMRTYAVAALIALALVTAGAWVTAGRLLRPVRELRLTAREISDTDFTRRIAVTGNDDLSDLARTFNAMLDRLEDSFLLQRRFLDDAGHELRTPITIVRGHLDVVEASDPDDVKITRELVLDELERMGRLVDDLVVLARAGQPDFVRLAPADAGVLTDDVLDKSRALGERDWALDLRAEGDVVVDAQRITQALLQLAKNAVQHTRPGDEIAIGSSVDDQEASWWVRDTGLGVAHGDAERIFARFQRGHQSRGNEGSGLGLSIVTAIATGHGGRVHVDPNPGHGATFTLVLPRRAHVPTHGLYDPNHPTAGSHPITRQEQL
jgi:signal transduction histidine kinase